MENKDEIKFKEAEKRLDTVQTKAFQDRKKNYSNTKIKPTTYITISDVRPEDAEWLKKWMDDHAQGKQFLGLTALRSIVENNDTIIKNVMRQISDLQEKFDSHDDILTSLITELQTPKPKNVIPKTQGSALRTPQ